MGRGCLYGVLRPWRELEEHGAVIAQERLPRASRAAGGKALDPQRHGNAWQCFGVIPCPARCEDQVGQQ